VFGYFFHLVCAKQGSEFLVVRHGGPSPSIRFILESSELGNATRVRDRSETSHRTNQSSHASLCPPGILFVPGSNL
jgi:hypothetical protein